MKRRDFLLAASMFVAGMPHAIAQQSSTKKRIAVMILGPWKAAEIMRIGRDPIGTAFLEELKRLGYVEGENLVIDRYVARAQNYAEVSREVVDAHPDVIVCYTITLAARFKELTSTIPSS